MVSAGSRLLLSKSIAPFCGYFCANERYRSLDSETVSPEHTRRPFLLDRGGAVRFSTVRYVRRALALSV